MSSSLRRQRPSRVSARGKELPEGWLRWYDESSQSHYYEDPSGQTTWDDPTRWRLSDWIERLRGSSEQEENPPKSESMSMSIEEAFAACGGVREGFDERDAEDETELPSEAKLHVYDVSFRGAKVLNSVLMKRGGAYHTGIEIWNREWSYGASVEGCGIFSCAPRRCRPHEYRETISLGLSHKSELDVFDTLLRLAPYWSGDSYDVLRKNCNSFCIVFAGALGVDHVPAWIHSLGDGAAEFDDIARRAISNFWGPRRVDSASVVARAAVVADNFGAWQLDHFQTYEDAKRRYDDLPFTHAAVLFVRFDSDPPGAWHTAHRYGLRHAVHNIQRRFLVTKDLFKPTDTTPRAA
ncbi:hypothetical protein CTAYLR_003092 [Chrysophaeum taylorii]|uniref:WW domain-containing protein n=1 Tax=Chrysophaeum taylorii TaxID=2483200 RepID=A0AAD7U5L4_9STRA|nr:hypothetical protein CTAYLR_003092 [Chrysophaeum taylorii]